MRRRAADRKALVFLALLAAGVLLFAGVLIALLLPSGKSRKHTAPPATEQATTQAAPPATTPPSPPPATTAPPPSTGPLEAVAVAPLAATVRWNGPSTPARVGYGLPDLGPTMWAPFRGRRATLTGLHYSTAYRVWAGDTALDIATPGPPAAPAASIGSGTIRLDGQPYFPLIVYAVCPNAFPEALASGITLFAENPCGGIADQVAGLAGRAFSLTKVDEAGSSGQGVIGWYYPDEADLKGITGPTLPSFPSPETTHRLRVLTLTNHFYSRTAELPGGRAVYPPLIAKSDVVGFDLYPLQEFCDAAWLPDVAYAQRELVTLAQGRPTFQWVETRSWKCRRAGLLVTPATVRAESWLSVAGGARGIGYFPGEWDDPAVSGAVKQIAKEVAAIGGGLLAPESPASATGPVVVGARSSGGALYVIAVNPTRSTVRSTITARGLAGRPVGVLEEGRDVASSGDSFTDSFGPLGVHLYVVTPS